MTISPFPLLDVSDVGTSWPDDVVDLNDRRRLLVLAVLGADVPRPHIDGVFDADLDHSSSSSTTRRSAGRVPRTDDT